jgi:hypothetical protein
MKPPWLKFLRGVMPLSKNFDDIPEVTLAKA